MKKINHNKFSKKLPLYVVALTVSAGTSTLTGCSNSVQNTNASTPTEIVNDGTMAPAIDVKLTITPTAIPTVTPTTIPTPTIAPSERRVSADDLLLIDNVYNDYFGPEEDFETEFNKRKEYLKSFNILSDEEITVMISFMNALHFVEEKKVSVGEKMLLECYQTIPTIPNSNITDEIRNKYLQYINGKYEPINLAACDKVTQYNLDNPDNQIVYSWLAIGNVALSQEERAILNNFQKEAHKGFSNIGMLSYPDNYTISCDVKNHNSKSINIKIDTDDLNNVCKYFMIALAHKVVVNVYNEYKSYNSVKSTYDANLVCLSNVQDVILDMDRITEKTTRFTGNYYYNPLYSSGIIRYKEAHSTEEYEEYLKEKAKFIQMLQEQEQNN